MVNTYSYIIKVYDLQCHCCIKLAFCIISSIAPKKQPVNTPSGEQFLNHYKQLSHPVKSSDFDYEHEALAKSSLSLHDASVQHPLHSDDLKNNI